MAEESGEEPLTRRRPGENRGHQPSGRVGSAQLPEDVLRRALTAIRSGAEAQDQASAPETAAAKKAAAQTAAPQPPARERQAAAGRSGAALPAPRRDQPLGFGPGA